MTAAADTSGAMGERVELSAAEERAAICYALGCIDEPGVPLRFVERLRQDISKQIGRNADLHRMWDLASPTELQFLIEAAEAGSKALRAIRDDMVANNSVSGRNQTLGQNAIERISSVLHPDAWDRSKDLRARLANGFTVLAEIDVTAISALAKGCALTCESGGGRLPRIVVVFPSLPEAQQANEALATDLRARIAAAPAPAPTDHSGEPHA